MTQPPYADLERHVPEEDEWLAAFERYQARRHRRYEPLVLMGRPSWFARWRRRLARWLGRGT